MFRDIYSMYVPEFGCEVWIHFAIFDTYYRTAVEALVAGDEHFAVNYSTVADMLGIEDLV